MTPNESPELLTKAETAALLRVSLKTLDRYRESKVLVPIKLGDHTVRYRSEDVAALIKPTEASA
jgi:predicted site-specific integrase-resolvase